MPSGSTHDRITLWTLPMVAGLTLVVTRNSLPTLMICAGYLFGGLMLGPDLDLHSIHYKRWGWFRWIWLPYRNNIRHRSPYSHAPIMGTTLRVIYLLMWMGVAGFLGTALLNEFFQMGWTWGAMGREINQFLRRYLAEAIALCIGLELGAFSHYTADWLVSSHKQRKKKKKMTEAQHFLPGLQRLVEVVAQLRSPIGGCPWDLEQTPETLIPYVLEEAYEVVDAIRQGEPEAIADELGDLLLQVVLQAQIASETGAFDLGTVVKGITEKLIRRHPHVFAEVQVDGVEEVRRNWEEIKGAEAAGKAQSTTDRLAQYERSLPPMTAAMKISNKAAAVGFEWENVEGVWAKFHEELAELEAAIRDEPKENQQAELGDLLFTVVNLARWYGLDPDEGLRGTNERFVQRFEQVEGAIAQMGGDRSLTDYSLEELEALWQEAKVRLSS